MIYFSFEMSHLEGLDDVATGSVTCDVIPRKREIKAKRCTDPLKITPEVFFMPLIDKCCVLV